MMRDIHDVAQRVADLAEGLEDSFVAATSKDIALTRRVCTSYPKPT